VDRFEAMTMLLAAVEEGSLSAAARQLCVPIPSLIRKVNELEEMLGTQLLKRTTRRLTLTEAGISYVVAARRILGLVMEQEREATGELNVARGELVVAAPVQIGRELLLPPVLAFLDAYPDVNVSLTMLEREADMPDAHLDAALLLGRLADSSMIATPLGSMRTVVCGSPALFDRLGMPRNAEDLIGMPCVLLEGYGRSPTWHFRARDTNEALMISVKRRLQVKTLDAAVDAAIFGLGIVQLPAHYAREPVAAGRLKVVLDAYEVDPMPVNLVRHSCGPMPLKLRCFIDFIVPRLRNVFGPPYL
jgi:DNA-binding transcriptional LysR family regulator